MLIVFTAIVGMFVSVPGWPGAVPLVFGTLGIGLASSSAAVFNHVLDALHIWKHHAGELDFAHAKRAAATGCAEPAKKKAGHLP